MNKQQLKVREKQPLIESARNRKVNQQERTASPINQILSKMRKQASPNLSARSPKECASRISHECEQILNLEGILEMEERKKRIRDLKQLLMDNTDKLLELDSLIYQMQYFEDSINQILKRLKILKGEIVEQINRQNSQANITIIKESIKQMSEDIQINEVNIIKDMQMKPFNNIMAAYTKKCQDHFEKLDLMILNTKQLVEFKEMCKQIEQRLLQISNASPHFKEV